MVARFTIRIVVAENEDLFKRGRTDNVGPTEFDRRMSIGIGLFWPMFIWVVVPSYVWHIYIKEHLTDDQVILKWILGK